MVSNVDTGVVFPVLAVLGAVAFLSLHHLVVWLGRREDRLHLFACVWFATSTGHLWQRLVLHNAGDPNLAVSASRVLFAPAFLFLVMTVVLTHVLVGAPLRTRGAAGFIALNALLLVVHWMTPAFLTTEAYQRTDSTGEVVWMVRVGPLLPLVAAYAVGVLAYCLVMTLRSASPERRERLPFAFGLCAVVALAIHDSLYGLQAIRSVPLFDYAPVVLGLGLTFMLSARYARQRNELERRVVLGTTEIQRRSDELTHAIAHAGEMRRSSARLATAVEHAADAVIISTADGRIEYVNGALERLAGVKRDDVRGQSIHTLFVAGRSPWSAQAGQATWRGQLNVQRAGGELIHVDITVSPVPSDDGRMTHFVTVTRDVTKERRAHEALRRSEASFRALIDGSPDAVLVHRHGRFVFVNRAALQFLGYLHVDELVGRQLEETVPPEDRAVVLERFSSLASSGQPAAVEQVFLRQDGAGTVGEVVQLPVVFDGEAAHLLIVRDLTERKQLHARLVTADRLASLGTLAAGVAHEINNPLSFVMTNLLVLRRTVEKLALSEKQAADMEEIIDEAVLGADRVRLIVRDLKTFSRPNDQPSGPVDVHAILQTSLKMTDAEIRHRARLHEEYEDVPLVRGDGARLGQVFVNLLVNAAQAIPEGNADNHAISVRVRLEPDGMVSVEICDTGAGIPPELLGKIFDPFFTTKPVGVGTGLGLSICHSIVEGLGGTLSVDRAPERGTRVIVRLCAAGDVDEQPGDRQMERLPRQPGRLRILIVDDERLVTESLSRVLGEHEVVCTTSGREAVSVLASKAVFDVILCDMMMPDMTGADVYEHACRQSRGLAERFVFMTGGAFTPRAREFLERVNNRRLEKPFDAEALLALLHASGTPRAAAASHAS